MLLYTLHSIPGISLELTLYKKPQPSSKHLCQAQEFYETRKHLGAEKGNKEISESAERVLTGNSKNPLSERDVQYIYSHVKKIKGSVSGLGNAYIMELIQALGTWASANKVDLVEVVRLIEKNRENKNIKNSPS